MFLFYYVALLSLKLPENLFSCQVCVLEKIYGNDFFCFFCLCVRLVSFCLCFCFIMLPCSPENLPEKLSSCQARVLENFSGTNLFLAFVSGWCFLLLLCPIFGCKPMGVVTGLGSPPSPSLAGLALSLSLSLSFFPWGLAGAGALPRAALPPQPRFSQGTDVRSGPQLAQRRSPSCPPLPPFAPPFPPRRGRSPLLPAVSSSLSSCLSVFLWPLFLVLSFSFFSPSLSVWLSVCLRVFLSVCLLVGVSFCLSVCLFVRLFCLAVLLFVCLFVCSSVRSSFCSSVCLSVCLSFSFSFFFSLSLSLSLCLSFARITSLRDELQCFVLPSSNATLIFVCRVVCFVCSLSFFFVSLSLSLSLSFSLSLSLPQLSTVHEESNKRESASAWP